jgi:hypothetical protein
VWFPKGIEGADQIVLLDHTSRKQTPNGVTMNAMLDKNRHGPSVSVPITLDTKSLRMREPLAVYEGAPQWYDREGA